jgi:hypothetical protein
MKSTAKWALGAFGLAAATYATSVGVTWSRYGNPTRARRGDEDLLLDLFMPNYEVADRHKVNVDAPAEVVLAAASDIQLEDCALIRGIFKTREVILGGKPDHTIRPRKFLEQVKALGWGVLAEAPGREIVVGAVTRPWEANPEFRALPPEAFQAFQEPGHVKIAWTLRATPDGNGKSVFHTETRALATDPESRKKFRRYWAFLSPGIIAIRKIMLPVTKAQAERRWREVAA